MEVDWIDVESDLPPDAGYGTSGQVMVKTQDGFITTAYYSHLRQTWYTDNLLVRQDFVRYWLKGLK